MRIDQYQGILLLFALSAYAIKFKNLFMLSVRISSYGCTGKFGGQEKCVRVARGAAESNSSFLSALQTS